MTDSTRSDLEHTIARLMLEASEHRILGAPGNIALADRNMRCVQTLRAMLALFTPKGDE